MSGGTYRFIWGWCTCDHRSHDGKEPDDREAHDSKITVKNERSWYLMMGVKIRVLKYL